MDHICNLPPLSDHACACVGDVLYVFCTTEGMHFVEILIPRTAEN